MWHICMLYGNKTQIMVSDGIVYYFVIAFGLPLVSMVILRVGVGLPNRSVSHHEMGRLITCFFRTVVVGPL